MREREKRQWGEVVLALGIQDLYNSTFDAVGR
jgi:hypothetical protein